MADGELWFYSDGQTQKGPFERHAIELLIAQGQLGAETLIWRNGLPAWAPARQVAEFASRFGAATPPPVPPTPSVSTPPPHPPSATPSSVSPAAVPTPSPDSVFVTPVPPPVPPPRKGLHPLAWVAMGCGCLVLLGIAAAVVIFLVAGSAVKQTVEAKDDSQAVTETFLRDIAAGRGRAAYDSTDAGFKKSTTFQDFAHVASTLQDLGPLPPLTCQEKEVVSDVQFGTVYKRVFVAKYPGQSMKYTFHLRQEGGKLRVLALHFEAEK
jgi:hypothetical protein